MKVKELLKEVKANRYTYYNLDKETIKQLLIMRKLTLKELEELNQINNNEIYRLRRIITQQGKDIASKDKLISGLAKQINKQVI